MTSKRLFSNAFSLDFRREIAPFILYFIVFFVCLPLSFIIWRSLTFPVMGVTMSLYEIVHSLVFGSAQIFLVLFAFTETLHQFGFLHRRQETDFVHALPVSRTKIFFTRFVSGILSVLIPFLTCEILAALIVRFAFNVQGFFVPYITGVGISVLFFLGIYSLNVTAYLLTGKTLTGVVGTLILQFFFPVIALFHDVLSGIRGSGELSLEFLAKWSPVTAFAEIADWFERIFYPAHYYSYWHADNPINGPLALAVMAVLVVLLYILNRWLYQKRPMERAGDAMSFAVTETPIQIILTVFGGLFGGIFFGTLAYNSFWYYFGVVFGAVLTHCLVELIYTTDIRQAFKKPVILTISLAVSLAIAALYSI